ncbi:hypothetical protein [Oceanivirga miroungae]|uniref:Uncharacterized protein n=1 Tax=Oceanivirga miroungae TaxID=1130046 RepID=A0A6I8MA87_9FUSO|nr:hypothetical protein [Oceanivirga miroungae]VWL85740.1 hypothetical protein OMES3154_01028 [Oceanivirga miroungae]
MTFLGILAQLRNVIKESLIQKSTYKNVMARVFSFRNILLKLIYFTSLFIASIIADKYVTIVYLLTTLFAIISPSIRKYR